MTSEKSTRPLSHHHCIIKLVVSMQGLEKDGRTDTCKPQNNLCDSSCSTVRLKLSFVVVLQLSRFLGDCLAFFVYFQLSRQTNCTHKGQSKQNRDAFKLHISLIQLPRVYLLSTPLSCAYLSGLKHRCALFGESCCCHKKKNISVLESIICNFDRKYKHSCF